MKKKVYERGTFSEKMVHKRVRGWTLKNHVFVALSLVSIGPAPDQCIEIRNCLKCVEFCGNILLLDNLIIDQVQVANNPDEIGRFLIKKKGSVLECSVVQLLEYHSKNRALSTFISIADEVGLSTGNYDIYSSTVSGFAFKKNTQRPVLASLPANSDDAEVGRTMKGTCVAEDRSRKNSTYKHALYNFT